MSEAKAIGAAAGVTSQTASMHHWKRAECGVWGRLMAVLGDQRFDVAFHLGEDTRMPLEHGWRQAPVVCHGHLRHASCRLATALRIMAALGILAGQRMSAKTFRGSSHKAAAMLPC